MKVITKHATQFVEGDERMSDEPWLFAVAM